MGVHRLLLSAMLLLAVAGGCAALGHGEPEAGHVHGDDPDDPHEMQRYCHDHRGHFEEMADGNCAVVIVAGGPFGKLRAAMANARGVHHAMIGYTGGFAKRFTYKDVCAGRTGHTEAVMVFYDKLHANLGDVLEALWQQCQRETHSEREMSQDYYGLQFRPTVFTKNGREAAAAQRSRDEFQAAAARRGAPVANMSSVAREFDGRFHVELQTEVQLALAYAESKQRKAAELVAEGDSVAQREGRRQKLLTAKLFLHELKGDDGSSGSGGGSGHRQNSGAADADGADEV